MTELKARYGRPFEYPASRVTLLGYVGEYDVYDYKGNGKYHKNKMWLMLQGPPRSGPDVSYHDKNRPREVELIRDSPDAPWTLARVYLGSETIIDTELCDIDALTLYVGGDTAVKFGDALDRLKA